jgi:signal transduction histidine kinase
MTRLRWKLLAAMIGLVVVTTAITAGFLRRVTHDQVRRLLTGPPPAPPADALRPLEAQVRAARGWGDVGPALAQVAAALGGPVVLTDPGGGVLAVSPALRAARVVARGAELTIDGPIDGAERHLQLGRAPLPVRDAAGQVVAQLYAVPVDLPGDSVATRRELAAVDRRLLGVFAIAIAVALALTVVLSRRITRPIEQLTAAVQDLARGRTPAHVAVRGRDELARLATSFNAMADAIATQAELRRRMAGDVAHELRTPLTSLRCELEAIQDGLAAPEPARLASLHDEVLHLQRLVEDLQDLEVAEAGGMVLARARLDLGASVARIVGAQAELDCATGVVVDADPTRLRQIVDNVLANALRHAPAGVPVRVVVARTAREATVAVIDRGPGIPAGELDRIFERFYRVDAARDRARGGAGLGLAIVRQLVELHGGRVWAESAGAGATVTFALPLAASSPAHNEASG